MRDPLPVLWLCGASGAGKSTAAWALCRELAAAGTRVAHVDIDQLGMLYPAGVADPDRHHLKTEVLRQLIDGYAWAGAQILVVSGVVDVTRGPADILGSDADLTLVLLTPGDATLRQRLTARGWTQDQVASALPEDAALRRSKFMNEIIKSDGMSVADIVGQLMAHVHPAPADNARPTARPRQRLDPSDVIVVTGPRAAGSSTVAFSLARSRWDAGKHTGFADLQQLSFIDGGTDTSPGRSAFALRQVAALHDTFARHGLESLVIAGHITPDGCQDLRAALTPAHLDVVCLRADADTIAAHVARRSATDVGRLAGDDLLNASRDHQARVIAASCAQQKTFDGYAGTDALCIDVSGHQPAEAIARAERALGEATHSR